MANIKKSTYDIDIGIMRIISAFFVVMIHSSGAYSLHSGVALLLNSISRFSVPVFVIISGYYMLDTKRSSDYIVRKCAALFFKMIMWAGIYYIFDLWRGERSYSGVVALIKYLLTEPVHLWYCYASIVLYMFTPLLYVFSKNASKKEYQYFLALSFFFGSIIVVILRSGYVPTISYIVDKMKVPYTLGFVFLYLFGGYIKRFGIESALHRVIVCVVGVIGMITTFVGSYLLSSTNISFDWLLSFFAPNNILASLGVFVIIQQVCRRFYDKLSRVQFLIRRVSDCTLGIYLLHPLILLILRNFSVSASLSVLIIYRVFLSFIISLIIVFAVKHIPCLRRLV